MFITVEQSYIMYTDSLSPMEINGRYNQILEGLIVNAYTVYYTPS